MKKGILITIVVLSLAFTSCSKDTCLEDKLEVIAKYDRLLQQAAGVQAELLIILRNKEIELSGFDC